MAHTRPVQSPSPQRERSSRTAVVGVLLKDTIGGFQSALELLRVGVLLSEKGSQRDEVCSRSRDHEPPDRGTACAPCCRRGSSPSPAACRLGQMPWTSLQRSRSQGNQPAEQGKRTDWPGTAGLVRPVRKCRMRFARGWRALQAVDRRRPSATCIASAPKAMPACSRRCCDLEAGGLVALGAPRTKKAIEGDHQSRRLALQVAKVAVHVLEEDLEAYYNDWVPNCR